MFMVRIGTKQVAWSQVELQHGQTYDIVAQLSKSKASKEPANEGLVEDAAFDTLSLWIDPRPEDFAQPDAVIQDAPGIKLVRWIGFSTAQMTAFADEVQVDSLLLAESWEAILAESSRNFVPRSTANEVVWDQPVDFADDIYPLLKSRCFDCHAGDQPYSGVRLDIRRELLGYSSGEVLAEPGRGHNSKLIEAVSAEDADERMPPDGDEPLTAEQIAMLRAWIDRGMNWDEQLLPTPKLQSDHWAFQLVSPPAIPRVNDTAWLRTPVDAFIARAQAAAGVVHSEEASRQILVRRLYLDLIGLPPTPEQVDAFVNDSSPGAYERLVEELLESPHYGERWGRYWLDLARWAESQGFQHDIVRPFAWRYRDYVIDSFNKDKPYDTFIKEQLAGDELEPYSDEQLIATAFWALRASAAIKRMSPSREMTCWLISPTQQARPCWA
jgi:hypothetical protein